MFTIKKKKKRRKEQGKKFIYSKQTIYVRQSNSNKAKQQYYGKIG